MNGKPVLNGKKIVVIGVSQEIGEAISKALVETEASVVFIGVGDSNF